jgi:protein-S-isoprenylcysteine O-methyltransferase Ste14
LNSAYQILLPAEFILAFLVFGLLFRVDAPYGKFVRSGWGPVKSARIAWFVQEFPAFATITVMFIVLDGSSHFMNWIFLAIWQFHYIRRTFIYPFTLGTGSKPYPLLLVLFAVIFNIMNGFINGYYLFKLSAYPSDWLYHFRFIFGVMLFISGYIINYKSDQFLRKMKDQAKGKYIIPRGGIFQWISCPHYFGEILEWSGWALLTWSLPGLAFAIFTFANLAPRALAHHRWYKEHFNDYPSSRKALIPFIW